MNRKLLILLSGFIFLLFFKNVFSITYYVSTNGDSSSPTSGDPTKAYQSIQYAIDQTSTGDTVFLFEGNYSINSTILINKSSISLVGADSSNTTINILGDSINNSFGIKASSVDSIVLRGFKIVNANTGIYFYNVDNSSIINISVEQCFAHGILLNYSNNNIIKNNYVAENGKIGIYLTYSYYCIVEGNYAENNDWNGIFFYISPNCTISKNISKNNKWANLQFGGFETSHFYQNITSDNLLNGKILKYLADTSNITIDGEQFGTLLAVNCDSITIKNLNLFHGGIQLISVTNSQILNNVISYSYNGIYLTNSDSNLIKNNTLYKNDHSGLYFYNSNYNVVKNNISVGSTRWGIVGSTNNTVCYNDIWGNTTDFADPAFENNSISVNPLFVDSTDPLSDQYLHLSAASPCIDAGDPTDPVPEGGGNRIDIGAFEFVGEKSQATVWFVNDTSTVGDIYTSNTGDDNNSGNSNTPFRTITKALSVAKSGDTIFIDAGLYEEFLVIDTNAIALIGADSNITIIDPPGSADYAENGIYASTQEKLIIKNLRITDGYYGIYFNNIDSSTIMNVQSDNNYKSGFYLYNSCEYNNLQDNYAYANQEFGYWLYSNTRNNILKNNQSTCNYTGFVIENSSDSNKLLYNISRENYWHGFQIFLSSYNVLSGNISKRDDHAGVSITGIDTPHFDQNIVNDNYINHKLVKYLKNVSDTTVCDDNIGALFVFNADSIIIRNLKLEHGMITLAGVNNSLIENNIISDGNGFFIFNSEKNLFKNNKVFNSWHGITVRASFNLFENNISVNNSKGSCIAAPSKYNIFRNNVFFSNMYYGIWLTDGSSNNTIKNNIIAKNSSYGIYQSSGQNNIFIYNDIWGNGSGDYYGAIGGEGSISADTLFANDSDSTASDYLHLSAGSPCIDAGDPADTVPPGGGSRIDIGAFEFIPGEKSLGTIWFVNDSSTVGDIYTINTGDDDNAGNSNAPFRTITKALSVAKSGDTIFIDAGLYEESLVIDTNAIALIGADSQNTIIKPSGDSTVSDAYGIYAYNVSGLSIKNLKVTNGYHGIFFSYVETSVIENVQLNHNFRDGVFIKNGGGNTIKKCFASYNNAGFHIYESINNILINNLTNNDTGGFYFWASSKNTISGNISNGDLFAGFWFFGFDTAHLEQNILNNNFVNGKFVKYLKDISDTVIDGNVIGSLVIWRADSVIIKNIDIEHGGIYLGGVNNSIIENNSVTHGAGIFLCASENNIIKKNFISNNISSIFLYNASNNTVNNNLSVLNFPGIGLRFNSDNNIIKNNVFYKNLTHGVEFYKYYLSDPVPDNNIIKNNIIVNNKKYGIYLTSGTTGNSFSYNDVWNNRSGNYYGLTTGTGSISADPLFANDSDSTTSDYLHLSAGSPCIDAGDPADTVPSGGGSRIDIGAFEFIPGEIRGLQLINADSTNTILQGSRTGIKCEVMNNPVKLDIKIINSASSIIFDTNIGVLSPDTFYIIFPDDITETPGFYVLYLKITSEVVKEYSIPFYVKSTGLALSSIVTGNLLKIAPMEIVLGDTFSISFKANQNDSYLLQIFYHSSDNDSLIYNNIYYLSSGINEIIINSNNIGIDGIFKIRMCLLNNPSQYLEGFIKISSKLKYFFIKNLGDSILTYTAVSPSDTLTFTISSITDKNIFRRERFFITSKGDSIYFSLTELSAGFYIITVEGEFGIASRIFEKKNKTTPFNIEFFDVYPKQLMYSTEAESIIFSFYLTGTTSNQTGEIIIFNPENNERTTYQLETLQDGFDTKIVAQSFTKGRYIAKLAVDNYYKFTSFKVISDTLEIHIEKNIIAYGGNDTTNIYCSSNFDTEISLKIISASGNLIYELTKYIEFSNSRIYQWSGCDSRGRPVAEGKYLLVAKYGAEKFVKKITVGFQNEPRGFIINAKKDATTNEINIKAIARFPITSNVVWADLYDSSSVKLVDSLELEREGKGRMFKASVSSLSTDFLKIRVYAYDIEGSLVENWGTIKTTTLIPGTTKKTLIDNDTISITLPANSTSAEASISKVDMDLSEENDIDFQGRAYDISLSGVSGLIESPLEIELPCNSDAYSDFTDEKLGVYYFDEQKETWKYMAKAEKMENNSVKFKTTHLTIFAIGSDIIPPDTPIIENISDNTISGYAEENATVIIYSDGTYEEVGAVDDDGYFNVTSAFSSGELLVCDKSGNYSPSVSFTLEADTKIPYSEPSFKIFNYPNPFNNLLESTNIVISIPKSISYGNAEIYIYNVAGELVYHATLGNLSGGFSYTFIWKGVNDYNNKVATGIYFAIVKIGDKRALTKIAVVR